MTTVTVAAFGVRPLAMYFAPSVPVEATIVVATVVGMGVLMRVRAALAGTTLVAPWWWSTLTFLIVTALELIVVVAERGTTSGPNAGAAGPVWTSHVSLVAASLTFCPLMGLLGAKRPQDRAWQFIVFSLAVVLLLPAAEGALFRPDSSLTLHAARRWFLAILVAITLVTGLPTRRWLATLLLVAGHVVLLGAHLPGMSQAAATLGMWRSPIGITLFAMALLAAAHPYPRRRTALAPWDRTWLDFRDSFGTLWGLRVIERFNDVARRSGWPVRLTWSGFEFEQEVQGELILQMRAAMASLLWRFVSDDWLQRRWPNADANTLATIERA
ncbi:MAG: hypothetical protein K2Y37_24895 [Pirellulales bacterium]|nr:hypothetical protein [Pirellulales bacterium]